MYSQRLAQFNFSLSTDSRPKIPYCGLGPLVAALVEGELDQNYYAPHGPNNNVFLTAWRHLPVLA